MLCNEEQPCFFWSLFPSLLAPDTVILQKKIVYWVIKKNPYPTHRGTSHLVQTETDILSNRSLESTGTWSSGWNILDGNLTPL